MTTITTSVITRIIDSPVGPLTLGATPRGLRFVWWPEDSRPLPAVDDGAIAITRLPLQYLGGLKAQPLSASVVAGVV
jgi:general secretion pathway protein C